MTEEIIIDGIDISECEFANACSEKMKCVILQDDVCETNPYCEGYNCYFKQLKRLEQENKELKEEIKAFGDLSEENMNKVYEKMLDYKTALEEINNICNETAGMYTNRKIQSLINEVFKQ